MTDKQEQQEKEKSGAPTTMILALIVLAGLLFALFVTGKDYYNTMQDLEVKTAAPAVRPLPTPKPAEQFDTEIKFRKFYLTAPGAKRVEILADFNNWGQSPIVLKEYNKSYFDVTVALASGEYKYVFLIDGKETLDPTNNDRVDFNGREVCIKTVR
ncbi:hypothetical protein Dip510_002143 [Elusimicrobium posterum]|uniref:glycogen-binding domain-containing protein n=1 Tax=Elusimicrobium posterum TaxID=3116653 RepID=UPI003C73B1ED